MVVFASGVFGLGMLRNRWACAGLFIYSRGLPLTIRSGLTPLFGRALEGSLGHIVDIFSEIATILGVSVTLGY